MTEKVVALVRQKGATTACWEPPSSTAVLWQRRAVRTSLAALTDRESAEYRGRC